jgi:hypothetical protein
VTTYILVIVTNVTDQKIVESSGLTCGNLVSLSLFGGSTKHVSRLSQLWNLDRGVSFLNLLAVPMLTMVLMRFARRFPRSSKVLVMVALLVMLHNVIPFGAKKTQYLEASAWLSAHTQTSDGIFYDDSRIAYYAGRGYPSMPVTREQLMTAEVAQKYRYFVFVARPDDAALRHLLEKQGKRTLVKFANRKGDTVLIVGD